MTESEKMRAWQEMTPEEQQTAVEAYRQEFRSVGLLNVLMGKATAPENPEPLEVYDARLTAERLEDERLQEIPPNMRDEV